MADLIAFAVVVVMAGGWLWFRTKTDRSVRTACLVLGGFQIVAAVCKLLLSGIYGDYAGFVVLGLGIMMIVFRKGWTLVVMAAVFIVVGVANIAVAITQGHYTFILWGVVQFVIAAIMLNFVRTAGTSHGSRSMPVSENERRDRTSR